VEIQKLISNCIKNDRKSQKDFYLLTADRLMNVSRRYSNDINDAKDILQNAFIKIFKNLNKFDFDKGNLDSWLTKIVINEALQLIRKKKGQMVKDKIMKEEFEELSTPEILSRLQAEDVLNVTAQLPEGYRIVFNMNIVEGYNHKEIAEALGITESTSRSQLTRAKKLLKKLLIEQKNAELC